MYLLPSEIKLCVKTINKIKDAEGRKGLGGTRGCMREKKNYFRSTGTDTSW